MAIDAYEFDEIARNVFAPAYPLLAEQIVRFTGISRGVCLDAGSGGGYLGLALASQSALQVCLLDESEENRSIAEANIAERSLHDRVWAVRGDVHEITLGDNTVDLVASRSSIFFWESPEQAFREIIRILVPGGYAYIGGGFGSEELSVSIGEQMLKRSPGWRARCDEKKGDTYFVEQLERAGIMKYLVIRDESGFWITFTKDINCSGEI